MNYEIVKVEDIGISVMVEGNHLVTIPIEAIASWSELLGYDDTQQVLEAILHVAVNGEPDPDPVTRENAWTGVFKALEEREQVAMAVSLAPVDPAVELRSTKLRQALATSPIKSRLEVEREKARASMGLPSPIPAAPQMRVMSARTTTEEQEPNPLESLGDIIEVRKQEFLSTFTPGDINGN